MVVPNMGVLGTASVGGMNIEADNSAFPLMIPLVVPYIGMCRD